MTRKKGGAQRAMFINFRVKNGTDPTWFQSIDTNIGEEGPLHAFFPETLDYFVLALDPYGYVGAVYPYTKQYSSTKEPGTYKRKRLQIEKDHYLRFEPRYLYPDLRRLAHSVLFAYDLENSSDFVSGMETLIFDNQGFNIGPGDPTGNLYTFALTADAISGGKWGPLDFAEGNDLYELFSLEDIEPQPTTKEEIRTWLKSKFPKATDAAINEIPLFQYSSILPEAQQVDNYIGTILEFYGIYDNLMKALLEFKAPNPNTKPTVLGLNAGSLMALGDTPDYKQFEEAVQKTQIILKEKLRDSLENYLNTENAERRMAAKEAVEKEYPPGLANIIKSYGNFKKEPKLAINKLAKKNRKTRKSRR